MQETMAPSAGPEVHRNFQGRKPLAHVSFASFMGLGKKRFSSVLELMLTQKVPHVKTNALICIVIHQEPKSTRFDPLGAESETLFFW